MTMRRITSPYVALLRFGRQRVRETEAIRDPGRRNLQLPLTRVSCHHDVTGGTRRARTSDVPRPTHQLTWDDAVLLLICWFLFIWLILGG